MRAALFDMDGTLVRTEEIWISALVDSLQRRGAKLDWLEVAKCEYGRPWNDCYANVRAKWPEYTPPQEILGGETSRFYHDYIQEHSIAIPASVELLRRLHDCGWRIAVVSGSGRASVEETMALIGVTGLLDEIVAEEDATRGKPSPEPFLVAAKRLGVSPEHCVVFEDSRAGVLSAKAAGMFCVALMQNSDFPYQEDLSEADLILENLGQFPIPTEGDN